MRKRAPTNVDELVGRNIRIHRLSKDMSQTELADRLGITFQQEKKKEKGPNRVGCGRILEISVILGVPLLALFEGSRLALASEGKSSPFDLIADPLSLRLVQAFAAIQKSDTR